MPKGELMLPHDTHGQSMVAGGGVVDGKVERPIAAGGKHRGIERERRANEHTHEIDRRSPERELLLRNVLTLADCVDHDGQASEHDRGNQISDEVLFVVL